MKNSSVTTNNKFIPLSEPFLVGKEWEYIKDCLDTNWVSTVGSYVEKFEEKSAEIIGKKYAVATASGTASLHVAIILSGVKENDEVIMPALSFIASANAVKYVGAYPVFLDISVNNWQLDSDKLAKFLQKDCDFNGGVLTNKHTGRVIKAILTVDILGHPSDVDQINLIAEQYGLNVIEDAAESVGALYKGESVGKRAAISCLSFNGNKIVTSGGGGMFLTDDEKVARKAKYLTTQAKDDSIESIHNEVGFNYRLTNIQAALGLAQLENLESFVTKKKSIAKNYRVGLNRVQGIQFQPVAEWAEPNCWLSTILVDENLYGMNSRSLMKRLSEVNIQSRPLWHPLYRLKPYSDCLAVQTPVVDQIHSSALSLPSSVSLNEEDQQVVIETIKQSAK